ncbi:YheV family putative zinc ribbon protein [Streptosporangium soli]|nr:hypothetical protein [Streptosporangium sp. KLBMP 9127]
MTLAHFLDGLRCADCHALDALWLDAMRGLVECRECGHRVTVIPDHLDERRNS